MEHTPRSANLRGFFMAAGTLQQRYSSTMPDETCPQTCPNRRGDGLNLFGVHFDPIEIMLQCAIVLLLVVPAIRASTKDDFDTQKAVQWLGAIAGACTLVRLSPTDRLNAYLKVTGKQ